MKRLELELDLLEEWFRNNPKLPEKIDRRLLLRFLKCMSDNVDETKKLIELNYELRNKNPHIFLKRDPADEITKKSLAALDSVPLPGLTPEGYKVVLGRLADYDASKCNSAEEAKIFFMIGDCRFAMADTEPKDSALNLAEDMAVGEVHIVDTTGYTMSHIARMSILIFRVSLKYLQTAYPVRMKATHIINCPSYLDKMMAIVKPFISEEVYKMLHFHTNGLDSLYEYVPRDMLPEEYGGTAGPIKDIKTKWMQILNEKRDYLMDAKQWRVQKV